MKPSFLTLVGLAIFALAVTGSAPSYGQTITYSGSVANSVGDAQVSDWRTATTPKTFDLDNNGVYGSFAAVNWTQGAANFQSVNSTTPGIAFVSSGDQFNGAASIDAVAASGKTTAGIALSFSGNTNVQNFVFTLTGTASTYTGMTVRIGVMQDVLTNSDQAIDINKTLQVVMNGGSAASTVVSVRGGAAGDGSPEMYFFDLTNVTVGQQFAILAPQEVRMDGGGTQAGYVSAVSFDLATSAVPIPEATGAQAMMIATGVALLGLPRLRRTISGGLAFLFSFCVRRGSHV